MSHSIGKFLREYQILNRNAAHASMNAKLFNNKDSYFNEKDELAKLKASHFNKEKIYTRIY